MAGYVLSEADRIALRTLLDSEKHKPTPNRRPTPTAEEIGQAPEVYVTRVPTEGIPALAGESGTGFNDHPGSAVCTIYRVLTASDGSTYLDSVSNFTKVVYNLTSSSIPGDTWILIIKDKYGTWFVAPQGTSKVIPLVSSALSSSVSMSFETLTLLRQDLLDASNFANDNDAVELEYVVKIIANGSIDTLANFIVRVRWGSTTLFYSGRFGGLTGTVGFLCLHVRSTITRVSSSLIGLNTIASIPGAIQASPPSPGSGSGSQSALIPHYNDSWFVGYAGVSPSVYVEGYVYPGTSGTGDNAGSMQASLVRITAYRAP